MKKAVVCFMLLTGSICARMQVLGKPVAVDMALPPIGGGKDTLSRYYDRSTGLFEYSISNEAGYVFGTGWDKEKKYILCRSLGMYYDGVKNARVIEILVMFYKAVVAGDAGTVTAKVYWVYKDTIPTEMLGSSTRSVADLDTAFNHFTSFPIDNAANTEGKPFLVAIEYGDNVGEPLITDDTIGVLGNDSEKHDGKGENRTRQFFYFSGVWKSSNAVFIGMDCDAMILPVIDFTTENNEAVSAKGLSVSGGYLNPHTGTVSIRYCIAAPQKVTIRVFTLSGETILNTGARYRDAGSHEQSVSLCGVSSGYYYYAVSTEDVSLTGRIVRCK
jgi:hypothetical protein